MPPVTAMSGFWSRAVGLVVVEIAAVQKGYGRDLGHSPGGFCYDPGYSLGLLLRSWLFAGLIVGIEAVHWNYCQDRSGVLGLLLGSQQCAEVIVWDQSETLGLLL